jgi:hypothetical protein
MRSSKTLDWAISSPMEGNMGLRETLQRILIEYSQAKAASLEGHPPWRNSFAVTLKAKFATFWVNWVRA